MAQCCMIARAWKFGLYIMNTFLLLVVRFVQFIDFLIQLLLPLFIVLCLNFFFIHLRWIFSLAWLPFRLGRWVITRLFLLLGIIRCSRFLFLLLRRFWLELLIFFIRRLAPLAFLFIAFFRRFFSWVLLSFFSFFARFLRRRLFVSLLIITGSCKSRCWHSN